MPTHQQQKRQKRKERNLQRQSQSYDSRQSDCSDMDSQITNRNGTTSTMSSPPSNTTGPCIQTTPYSGLAGLAIGTPRAASVLGDSSMAPPCKRGRPRKIQTNRGRKPKRLASDETSAADSDHSLSPSRITDSLSDTSCSSSRSRGGRPRKRRGGPGRPRKGNTSRQEMHSETPVSGMVPSTSTHFPTRDANFVMDNLLFPTSNPLQPGSDRVGPDFLYSSHNEIQQMWRNPSIMLEDHLLYAFLRYIASISRDLHVTVIDPSYSDLRLHQNVIPNPLNACYNYSADFDILLMTIFFPGHYGLIIFDRSVRDQYDCVYIDPLPPSQYDEFTNRLYDQNYPNYEQQRLELIKRTICELTPGITSQDFYIDVISPSHYTCQIDAVNCGFFIGLYSEAYIFGHRNLKLPNLNISIERKRILWHLSQLIYSDQIQYIPRQSQTPQIIPQSPDSVCQPSFTLTPFRESTPIHQTTTRRVTAASIALTPIRRSPRIAGRNSSREPSVESSNISVSPQRNHHLLTQRCYQRHVGVPCADVRARHTTDYYDSGNLGDKKCDFCDAQLFNSEATVKHGQTSSGLCCNFGTVQLPQISDPPIELRELCTQDTDKAKEYRRNQNAYNSLMAFASVSTGHIENTMAGGVCFLLNGEFVRQISSICPGQRTPCFSQLFILDPSAALANRLQNTRYRGNQVDAETLKKLDTILRSCHPLAEQLMNFHAQYERKLAEDGPDAVANFRLTLLEARLAPAIIQDPSLHPRQTNLPDERTMFAVWTESEYPPQNRGIWITTEEARLQHFPPYHPLTDTLCYPLLIPCGDDGYHKNIRKHRAPSPSESGDNEENQNSTTVHTDDEEDNLDDTASVMTSDSDPESLPVSETGRGGTRGKNYVSLRSYVRYRMSTRDQDGDYHHIWSAAGGLSQKLILDYAARVDSDVADYLRRPELDLRRSLPENMLRWLARLGNLASTDELGSVVLFRKCHPGSRAFFQDAYYDATTIMNRFKKIGCASFMLTWTCSTLWPEIKRNFLRPDQLMVDRPDIMCRVYEDKLRMLHELLDKKKILGNIIGYGESREFQKRIGGPHMHRVYHTDRLAIPENIENLIWAHIPADPASHDVSEWAQFIRKVRKLVIKHQIHTCGRHCLNVRGRCKKGFPKPYSMRTILFDDKNALYIRPSPQEGGESVTIGSGVARRIVSNADVVSYNPYILVRTETHHNVEFAYGQKTNLKYALKYPFKGPAFSYVKSADSAQTNVDEPAYYAKMLYRSPVEAFSRIQSYKYAFLSHIVIPLNCHLPGQQPAIFQQAQALPAAQQIQAGVLPETELTAYWRQCLTDPEIANTLFERMPEKYSFTRTTKAWKKRVFSTRSTNVKSRKGVIGRIYPVSPREQERFALYLLTKHFPGHHTTLLPGGCNTFLSAAKQRGLIEDSDVWIRTLDEAAASLRPNQMRQLFANILIFGNTEDCLIDAPMLWQRFLDHMYDHRRCTRAQRAARIERALALLERLLVDQGRTCADFGLPTPRISIVDDPQQGLGHYFFPMHLNDDDEDETVETGNFDRARLTNEQRDFFERIANVIQSPPSVGKQSLYRLFGNGGTGKTFLLNYILCMMRRMGKKVIATASTGTAATKFYAGSSTFHSAFRLGIDIEPGVLPSIPLDSFFGRRIIEADMVLIDEISCLDKVALENVDKICRLMCSHYGHLPFGGKIVIISGDWKQGLPVVLDGGVEEQVATCVQSSYLYPLFELVKLIENMRVDPGQSEFLDWLEQIGTGALGDLVAIPKEMIVDTANEISASVFDQGYDQPSGEMLKRLMLATTNRVVDINNAMILDTFTTNYVDYYSADKALDENPLAANAADFDVAQLNPLMPLGWPPHQLRLKEGSIIMLLKNLNIGSGLCNGTRMVVRELRPNLIIAEIATAGSNVGALHGIARSAFTQKSKHIGVVSFERFQFPVRTAYTMTVTKAQGQTAERLGIDFTEEPFAHGQLYSSISRASRKDKIWIYAPNKPRNENGDVLIRNVVAPGIRFD